MKVPRRNATHTIDGVLLEPRQGAHWRWATPRRALVGGSVLAAVLSLGPVAAGAATSAGSKAPTGAPSGARPATMAKPSASGKITALSGDTITLSGRGKTTQTVDYSSTTTFVDKSGTVTSAALKVGESIAVMGTTASDGTVTATSIMIGMGTRPPGGGGPTGRAGGKPPIGKGGGQGARPPRA